VLFINLIPPRGKNFLVDNTCVTLPWCSSPTFVDCEWVIPQEAPQLERIRLAKPQFFGTVEEDSFFPRKRTPGLKILKDGVLFGNFVRENVSPRRVWVLNTPQFLNGVTRYTPGGGPKRIIIVGFLKERVPTRAWEISLGEAPKSPFKEKCGPGNFSRGVSLREFFPQLEPQSVPGGRLCAPDIWYITFLGNSRCRYPVVKHVPRLRCIPAYSGGSQGNVIRATIWIWPHSVTPWKPVKFKGVLWGFYPGETQEFPGNPGCKEFHAHMGELQN